MIMAGVGQRGVLYRVSECNDIPPASADQSSSSDQQATHGWHLADYYRQSVLKLYEQLGEKQFFEWAGYQFYGYWETPRDLIKTSLGSGSDSPQK